MSHLRIRNKTVATDKVIQVMAAQINLMSEMLLQSLPPEMAQEYRKKHNKICYQFREEAGLPHIEPS